MQDSAEATLICVRAMHRFTCRYWCIWRYTAGNDQTPLHWACTAGSTDIAVQLMDCAKLHKVTRLAITAELLKFDF
jgi:hypothetical protein